MTTTTAPTWELEWRGRRWSSNDLTGHHAAAAAELLGTPPPWDFFDLSEMHPALGPLQTMTMIAACICVEDDIRGNAARRAVLELLKDIDLEQLADAVVIPE